MQNIFNPIVFTEGGSTTAKVPKNYKNHNVVLINAMCISVKKDKPSCNRICINEKHQNHYQAIHPKSKPSTQETMWFIILAFRVRNKNFIIHPVLLNLVLLVVFPFAFRITKVCDWFGISLFWTSILLHNDLY